MKNAADTETATVQTHRALAILRHLERASGYRSNVELLRDCLDRRCGLVAPHDRIMQDCRLLEQAGFLRIEEGEVMILQLTEAGREVADGTVISDQVERPWPDCPY